MNDPIKLDVGDITIVIDNGNVSTIYNKGEL